MMKFCSVLVLELWIAQGFCNEYWRTRNLSGSDYGVEYNLNHTGRNEDSGPGFRTLFNWNSSPARTTSSRSQFSEYDVKMMSNDVNGERNHSNIWWPWSNYEEWALARSRNGLNANELGRVKPTITYPMRPPQSKFDVGEVVRVKPTSPRPVDKTTKSAEEKKRRRKGRKRKHRKRKKNLEQTLLNNQIPMSNQIPREPSNMLGYGGYGADSARAATTDRGGFFGAPDNNEMDNEIHSSYNYNSIPVMDSRSSLADQLRRNQSLSHRFFAGYAVRNFTDDVNECLIDNGGCEGLCVNTPGSYKCHCPGGFKIDGNKCIDINECLLRNGHGPCQDKCVNHWGSYKCSCEDIPGTRLAPDGHTCEDIDECKEQTAGCSHECINTVGSAFCLCPKGFMLGMDWKTCHDVDECAMEEMQETRCAHRCENTIGSYVCLN